MDVLRKIVRHFLSQVVSSPSLFTLLKSVISRKNSLFYLFSRAKKNTNKVERILFKVDALLSNKCVSPPTIQY